MSIATPEATHSIPHAAHRPAPFAIVSDDLLRTGGMDRANLALVDYLARHGHLVHAVAHDIDEELRRQPNIVYHRVVKPANAYLLGSPFMAYRGQRVARNVAAEGGRVLVNGGNCAFGDINWVHYVHAAYRPQSAASLPYRLKNALSYRLFLAAEKKCLRMARVVIANSELTRRHLIDLVGVAPERVHAVYYGIDADVFAPASDVDRIAARHRFGWPENRPVVIFIGALGDRRKGFDTLFEAWKQLCQRESWDADLAVVGRGAELALWRQRAIDSGMAQRIRFLGFRSDVPDLLRAADALVAPTRYEAYGLGVQEAICCGLPSFVSKDAGVAERYPKSLESFLLPDYNDATDLASRLSAWRANQTASLDAWHAFSGELRRRTWDRMAEQIVQIAESQG